MPGFGGTPLGSEPQPSIDARGAFVAKAVAALELGAALVELLGGRGPRASGRGSYD